MKRRLAVVPAVAAAMTASLAINAVQAFALVDECGEQTAPAGNAQS